MVKPWEIALLTVAVAGAFCLGVVSYAVLSVIFGIC